MLRHLATAAVVLLAAPRAGAQPLLPFGVLERFDAPGARYYRVRGCDYSYANVFGRGARLCGDGVIGVGALLAIGVNDPNYPGSEPDTLYGVRTAFRFTGRVGYNFAGFDNYAPEPAFNNDTTFYSEDLDNGYFSQCREELCRGMSYPYEPFANGEFRISYSRYVPRFVSFTVSYYEDDIPTGTPRVTFGEPGVLNLDGIDFERGERVSTISLFVTPEPAPLALAGGGVVLLGVWGRRKRA